jgi:hypothetical protein
MAFKIGANTAYTNDGVPFLWGSGDQTTAPSNQVKIKASDGVAADVFGYAVGVGPSRIVVGAYGDNIGGNLDQGSAYIFNLSGTQLAKIVASDGANGDLFGYSVAAESGGIVVGAVNDTDTVTFGGAAYLFNLNGTQLAKLKASDGANGDYFGGSVAIGCGRIVVGAPSSDIGSNTDQGSAYIFNLSGTQLAKITASDGTTYDSFGASVAIGCGRIVIGATGSVFGPSITGYAYIFDMSGTQLAKIVASDGAGSDYFGYSVAIGCGRIVVGASGDDDNGGNSGSAYIFDLNGNQLAKIKASDGATGHNFGNSVSIGCGRIVIGSPYESSISVNSGATYIFDLDGTQIAKIKASDAGSSDYFGYSVAVGSGRIVVGAFTDDDLGEDSGSTYIFTTPMVYTPYDVAELNSYGQ